MRHRSEIESDAAAIADKPVVTDWEVCQLLRLQLEVLLDIRKQNQSPRGEIDRHIDDVDS